LLRSLPAVAVLGLVMSVTQYLLVTNGLWTLGATGAAMVGLVAGVGLTRLPFYRRNHTPEIEVPLQSPGDGKKRSLLVSFTAYAVLVIMAFAINLIPPLNELAGQVKLQLYFPELTTALGWVTPAETGRTISLFDHPGAILLYSSIIAFLVYSRAGYYQTGALKRILQRVSKGAVNSSLGILAMVGMAVMMSQSGMTNLLAQGLSESFGKSIYPAVAPLIGALGAFITGSNNNSNVLFAALQQRTAELLGLSVSLILAAQTTGGSLGSVMAPAKVIVGCSTVGLGDNEGLVMGRILVYGLIPVLVVALFTMLLVS
jgi:lactate permease